MTTRESTTRPPIAHQVAISPRLLPDLSTRCPSTRAPTNDMICISAPKPKLAAKVSPRCIITVGIHPETPTLQNRLRNADAQTPNVARRYLYCPTTPTKLTSFPP